MKKVFRCLGVMALMALAFTSCKKEGTQTSFKASIADFEVEAGEDRAYIDNFGKISFEVGDRVMIFNISEDSAAMSHCAAYKAVQRGNLVDFINSGMGTVGVALDGGYYAYYPSTLVPDSLDEWEFYSDRVHTLLDDGENRSEFYVSPTQTYRVNTDGTPIVSRKDFYLASHLTHDEAPNLGVAVFRMESICGIWKLQPYDSHMRTLTQIDITAPIALSGWVNVIIPEIDKDEMSALFNNFDLDDPTYVANLAAWKERVGYTVTESGNTITMNIPGGVQLPATRDENTTFNIVLRPLALTYGCQITFHFSDGTSGVKTIAPNVVNIKPNYMISNGIKLSNI